MRLGSDPARDGQSPAGWRATLLAAFVAFHVLAMLLLALPASGRLGERAVWESRENQLQFARWAQLASRLGIARDGPELEQRLWSLTQRYLSLRAAIIAPFELYRRLSGVGQGWRMFSNPQSHPAYVHIELRRAAHFEPIYIARSSESAWRAEQLDHHRVRKLFGSIARSTEQKLWEQFGAWAARRAARDFPDALELRIWQERRATPEPGGVAAAGVVLPEQVRVYDLRALR
ncbi:MAG TPA: hypothetical protein VFS67_17815 [Polyangiaceae bacterium]|nr:hypothetical protein [Polyangiaceae bacterium]